MIAVPPAIPSVVRLPFTAKAFIHENTLDLLLYNNGFQLMNLIKKYSHFFLFL